MNKQEIVIEFSNEIIWNNSNIYVGNNTIFYKTWHQLGIKYIKDIYDFSTKKFHSFEKNCTMSKMQIFLNIQVLCKTFQTTGKHS